MPSKASLWRRHHIEGPIDDRWNFLRLERDEASGILQVVESRKEWRSGSSSSRRTYYTQELIFPPDNDNGEGPVSDISAITNDNGISIVSQAADNEDNNGAGRPEEESGASPDIRLPQNVHPEDDSTYMMFNHRKTAIHSYYSTCSTFLDVIDDPSPDTPDIQRVRIRVGSRQLRQSPDIRREPEEDPLYPKQGIERLYQASQEYWPHENNTGEHDSRLDELALVLNPPSYQGNLLGTWDERSLLYATGQDAGRLRMLVFISFDSSIHLAGVKSWYETQGDQPTTGETAICSADSRSTTEAGDCLTRSQEDVGAGEEDGQTLTWRKPAMYTAYGFNFSR